MGKEAVTREWLHEQYVVEGKTYKEMADLAETNVSFIYLQLRQFQLRKSDLPTSPEAPKEFRVRSQKITKDWLIEHHVDKGMTLQEIGDLLGVTRERARQLLKREGIPNTKTNRVPKRHPRNLYDFNENFFDVIDTEEKAYWLGFAAAKLRIVTADTGIKTIYANMRTSRIDHLDKFKEAIGLIKPNMQSVSTVGGAEYVTHTLSIPSSHMAHVLEFYGIETPKHDNVCLPEIPEELIHHCFRGYFETKAFAWQKERHHMFIAMGSLPIMKDFTSYTSSYGITLASIYKSDTHNYYRINMGKKTGKAVLDILYKDATVYLPDRKAHFESFYGQL